MFGLTLVLVPGGLPVCSAASIVVGSFQKSASTGTQTISHSLGETPKAIILWTAHVTSESSTGGLARFSLGVADGTTEGAVSGRADDNVGTTNTETRVATKAIVISGNAECDLTGWTSSNFTLDWTTNLGTTSTIHYALIGGSDISAKVIQWSSNNSTGTQAVTGVGFQPDVVLHLYSGSIGTVNSSTNALDLSFGVMDATGRQWGLSLYSLDNQGTANAQRGQRTDLCFYDLNSNLTTWRSGAFSSMDSDGFSVNWTAAPTTLPVFSLCLSGLNARADTFNKSTGSAPAEQSITGVNFTPELLFLASFQRVSSPSSGATHSRLGFGATDGTNEGAIAMQDTDAVGTTRCDRIGKTSKVCIVMDNSSGTVDAEADFTSFDDDGFTLDWTTNHATATEICYLALVPFSSIAVELTDLCAETTAAGVEVTWETESELDNVGFRVWRDSPRRPRTLVDGALIPGSAFLASEGTLLASRNTYRIVDPDGLPGDRYFVDAIDLDGAVDRHGPVIATALPSWAPAPSTVSASSRAASGLIDTPRPRVMSIVHPADPALAADLADTPALKIGIDREGWIEVPHADWIAAGLPSPVPSALLRLHRRAREVRIEVDDGDDGLFGPGDVVRFLGLPIDTLDSTTDVAWLSLGTSPGLRILAPPPALVALSQVTTFPHTIRDATPTQYFAALRNGDAGNFFGPLITDSTLERVLALPDHDPASPDPVTLEVTLQGLGSADHAVVVSVAGTPLGTISWNGQTIASETFVVPAALVTPGLVVGLTAATAGDFSFLASIDLTYPRRLPNGAVLGPSILRGTIPAASSATFPALPFGTRILDVTDPDAVRPFPTSLIVGSDRALVDLVLSNPTATTRTWLVVPPGAEIGPVWTTANEPSRHRDTRLDAEFLIVAPAAWRDALRPLVDLRVAEGLATSVLAFEDLCDEYRSGMVDGRVISHYLRDQSTLGSPVRYLLIVGDACLDPARRIAGSLPTVIPTRLIDSARLETASDAAFGDLDGDGRAEIAVGRLPARDAAEVSAYVARVVAHEARRAQLPTPAPPVEVLLAVDDDDSVPFTTQRARTIRALPPGCALTLIDRNTTGIERARASLVAAIDAGTDLVGYLGHGGTGGWGAEQLLTTTDVAALGTPGRAPIVVATSCLNGYFHHRTAETMAETWLRAPNGPLALYASSDFTNPYPQSALGAFLLERLTTAAAASPRLGDLLLDAHDAEDVDRGTIRTTVLLGDPTARR